MTDQPSASGQIQPLDKRRVRWLCRRGWKEHDVLCERFMAEEYDAASVEEQAAFARLLAFDDPDFGAILGGKMPPPDDGVAALIPRLVMPAGRGAG